MKYGQKHGQTHPKECNAKDSCNVKIPVLEVFAQRCSVKNVFLEISQNSQENTCAGVSFLIKLQV